MAGLWDNIVGVGNALGGVATTAGQGLASLFTGGNSGGGTNQSPVSGGASQYGAFSTANPSYNPKTQTPPPTQPPATPPSNKGGAAKTAQQSTPAFNIDQQVAGQKATAQANADSQNAMIQSGINAAYDPIFAALDKMIGMAPEQKAAMESEVTRLAQSQQTSAQAEQDNNLKSIDASRAGEQATASSSLRNLEQDIRNQLQAQQYYFGAKGAADSSAPLMASEGVAREGLKSRSTVLSTRDQALAVLDQKKADVNTLATKQNADIEDWKASKLYDIGQEFSNRLQKLEMEKANAGSEKQKSLLSLKLDTERQFQAALTKLDDEITSYKSSVATWEMQRQAALDDYKTKLGLASSYSNADTTKAYQTANEIFNKNVAITGSVTNARNAAYQATGVDLLQGLDTNGVDSLQSNVSQLLLKNNNPFMLNTPTTTQNNGFFGIGATQSQDPAPVGLSSAVPLLQ